MISLSCSVITSSWEVRNEGQLEHVPNGPREVTEHAKRSLVSVADFGGNGGE